MPTKSEIEILLDFMKINVDFFAAPFLTPNAFNSWSLLQSQDLNNLSDDIKKVIPEESLGWFMVTITSENKFQSEDKKNFLPTSHCLISGDVTPLRGFLSENPPVAEAIKAHQYNPIIDKWYAENATLEQHLNRTQSLIDLTKQDTKNLIEIIQDIQREKQATEDVLLKLNEQEEVLTLRVNASNTLLSTVQAEKEEIGTKLKALSEGIQSWQELEQVRSCSLEQKRLLLKQLQQKQRQEKLETELNTILNTIDQKLEVYNKYLKDQIKRNSENITVSEDGNLLISKEENLLNQEERLLWVKHNTVDNLRNTLAKTPRSTAEQRLKNFAIEIKKPDVQKIMNSQRDPMGIWLLKGIYQLLRKAVSKGANLPIYYQNTAGVFRFWKSESNILGKSIKADLHQAPALGS